MSLILKPKADATDEYLVMHGELQVGQIYKRKAALRVEAQWLWALNGVPAGSGGGHNGSGCDPRRCLCCPETKLVEVVDIGTTVGSWRRTAVIFMSMGLLGGDRRPHHASGVISSEPGDARSHDALYDNRDLIGHPNSQAAAAAGGNGVIQQRRIRSN